MIVKHSKVSSIGDESNVDLIRPSDWNDKHEVTGRACFSDHKAVGTAGGSASAATWHTRVLNTTEYNNISDCSLASNQITLGAGTYRIKASSPVICVGQHKIALYNVTDAVYSFDGTSEYADPANIANRAFMNSQIIISTQKVFELRHYCTFEKTGDGLGVTSNIGNYELYAIIEIEKIS